MVKDIYLGSCCKRDSPDWLTDVGGTLYFAARDATDGRQLWRRDGTAAGTRIVRDIFRVRGLSSVPISLTDVNGTL
jgi:ELWxxDGT repeat protein